MPPARTPLRQLVTDLHRGAVQHVGKPGNSLSSHTGLATRSHGQRPFRYRVSRFPRPRVNGKLKLLTCGDVVGAVVNAT